MDIWKKAGFHNCIVKGFTVRNKLVQLHEEYVKLGRLKSLNWDSSSSKFETLQENFIESCGELFDISVKNPEKIISNDRLRSTEAKQEDMAFLDDQKTDRKWYISEDLDEKYQKSLESKQQRAQRMETLKSKELASEEMSLVNQELEVSFDSHSSGEINVPSDESSSEEERHTNSTLKSNSKIMLNISPEDLIESTHEVFARYRVGVRAQTQVLASICNKAGLNLDDLNISKSTVHRKRYKKVEELGSQIVEEIRDTLRGKRLCLHFDGKQVKQIEEEHNMTVSVERIALSVTSPDFVDSNDLLLGVIQTESSKGVDQAEGILAMLEYYDIIDQVFAVCCDTTGSNTGEFRGAIVILAELIEKPLLWLLCRRHMLEVHISHVMESLTGEKTKGPRRGLYVKLQKEWPKFKVEVDKMENIVKFNWKLLPVGKPLYKLAIEALEFGKRALVLNTFQRGDYKNLCELMVLYLGGDVDGFKFHQPGACHEARFMADGIYLLTIAMTDKIINMMNCEEREMVNKAAFLVSICYAPWFLKSYMSDTATANDLMAYKSSYDIADEYPNLGAALTKSMGRHSWYLTEQLVVLAIADEDVEKDTKIQMIQKLLSVEKPANFDQKKPKLPELCRSTELIDLIGPESWILFHLTDTPREELEMWISDFKTPSYEAFKAFVKNLVFVNDCSERNIRLIQDFVHMYKSEDMKQNVMHVARSNRKKVDKNMPKSQLKNA